jgi:hypothetical protein
MLLHVRLQPPDDYNHKSDDHDHTLLHTTNDHHKSDDNHHTRHNHHKQDHDNKILHKADDDHDNKLNHIDYDRPHTRIRISRQRTDNTAHSTRIRLSDRPKTEIGE